ncbi:MAG: hypothetical protein ACLRLW_06385 [Terrisporobacter sp.]|uniref:hypothetical protein n=1 Tax=Terrisporobacter sp. TaxID=1965305 RepID=UPI0039A33948
MKKQYEKPSMSIDMFEANEYIAACWSISCNVPRGYGYYEINGIKGYQRGEDQYIDQGTGCGTTHTASGIEATGPSANAMWQPTTRKGENKGDPYEVFYWQARVPGKSSNHFSKVSDAKWDPNPNASN